MKDQKSQQTDANSSGLPGKFNKASSLIGMDVQNAEGQKLGDIKDIVIDLKKGKVSYAVLGAGGVLGIGEKLLAVPLSAFKQNTDRNCLVLQASKETISQAEGIGHDWPSVESPSFGAVPFWQDSEHKNTTVWTNSPGNQLK